MVLNLNSYGKLIVNWGENYHFSIYLVINAIGVTCCTVYSLINVSLILRGSGTLVHLQFPLLEQ